MGSFIFSNFFSKFNQVRLLAITNQLLFRRASIWYTARKKFVWYKVFIKKKSLSIEKKPPVLWSIYFELDMRLFLTYFTESGNKKIKKLKTVQHYCCLIFDDFSLRRLVRLRNDWISLLVHRQYLAHNYLGYYEIECNRDKSWNKKIKIYSTFIKNL